MSFFNVDQINSVLREYVNYGFVFKVKNTDHNHYRHHGIKVGKSLYVFIEDVLYILKIDPWLINKNVTYFRMLFYIRNNGYNLVRKYDSKIDNSNTNFMIQNSEFINEYAYLPEQKLEHTKITFNLTHGNLNDLKIPINNTFTLGFTNFDSSVYKITDLNLSSKNYLNISEQKKNKKFIELQDHNVDFKEKIAFIAELPKCDLVNCFKFVYEFQNIIDNCLSELHRNFYIYKKHKDFVRTQNPFAELIIVNKHETFLISEFNKIHCILSDDVFAMLRVTRLKRLSHKNNKGAWKNHTKLNSRDRKH